MFCLNSIDRLRTIPIDIPALSDSRVDDYRIQNGPLTYEFWGTGVSDAVLDIFQNWVDRSGFQDRWAALKRGDILNRSENRPVSHFALRDSNSPAYQNVRAAKQFAEKIHDGLIKGVTGKPFTHVVQVGIGGSELGPRAILEALRPYALLQNGLKLSWSFISNVDPDHVQDSLYGLNWETTLFIVASKSGSSQETLENWSAIQAEWAAQGFLPTQLYAQTVTISMPNSPLDRPEYLARFYIDEGVGGRFSGTSVMGGVITMLCYEPSFFESFLEGVKTLDDSATQMDIRQNMSLMSALIGAWYRNAHHMPVFSIIMYAQALRAFGEHLQQLDGESNGKSVTTTGEWVSYDTSPALIQGTGTDSQHSFFQKLHQGTDIIPIELVGFKSACTISTGSKHAQKMLNANFLAQTLAFLYGEKQKNPIHHFPGERPVSWVVADQLTPNVLGAIWAYYENRTLFQGWFWELNSFDQPGVELGKKIAISLLTEKASTDLERLKARIGL